MFAATLTGYFRPMYIFLQWIVFLLTKEASPSLLIHVHVDTCACGYMCMCASNGDKVGIIRNVATNRMMVGVASRILESVKFTDNNQDHNLILSFFYTH